jgi:hypothetical protein
MFTWKELFNNIYKPKLSRMILTNENNYLDPVSIFQISNTICLKSEVKDKLVSEHMKSRFMLRRKVHIK